MKYRLIYICAGPDPYPPQFTQDAYSTVCINSTNPEWSPVIYTDVAVCDNTGDFILNEAVFSNEFCLTFKTFYQTCAPFTVQATAHTLCSESLTAMYTSKHAACMHDLTIIYTCMHACNNNYNVNV